MRLALFTDTYLPQINGVARSLAKLVEHAAARGHEVALVTPSVPKQVMPVANAALHIARGSVPVPFYPELRLALMLDGWNGHRLRRFAPDIVHVATEYTMGWSGVLFAEANRIPLVSSYHTDIPAYLAGYGLGGLEAHSWNYLRAFHARAERTFCPSEATRRQLLAADFSSELGIWSRGVDARLFSPVRRSAEMRERLAPGAGQILLYVGRLAAEKRIDVLLRAHERVREQMPGTALVIVGDGPRGNELKRSAGAGVHFTGYMSGEELAAAYASSDIFAFASDTETFGNVVLEAMSCGLPVVAAAQGGVLDMVSDRTGALARPGDPDSFATEITRLLRDDTLRARTRLNARKAALQRSWDAVFDRLFGAYADVCDRRAARVA